MSRICVKALPKHITQERMLEVFSQVGDVTDVRLLKTKTGQRRNMGFVGFRNEDDAAKAINRLNNTFIDTSKIHVEVAKAIGSTELERPWSKHSKGSSRYELAHPELKKQRDLERLKEKEREKAEADSKKLDKNDPKLLEFLGIHKKAKKWENDDNMAEASDDDNKSKKRKIKGEVDGKNKKAKKETKQEEKIEKKNKPSSKSIEETPQAKVNVVTKDDIKKDKVLQAEFGDSDDDYEDLPNSKQALYLGDEDEMKEAEIDDVPMDDDAEDDMDYIKSKMQKGKKSTDSDESSDSEGDSASESEKEEGEEKNTGRTNEADTGRLFVRNLPFTITEDELRDLFGKYGLLSDVHIPQDKESNRSKGIAMVLYMVPSDATKAKEALDKAIFQGRVLHVMPGEEQRNIESLKKETPEGAGGGKRDSSFKEKKLKDQKAQSTNAHNWNSLYIRSDAVVDAFCARNNVNRSDIYDPSQPNLAVQLALMETQTIMETKNYFERQGVNIEVLSSSVDKAVKRSNTVILIKNIPFETTSNELTQQFEKHGPLARVIVPPSRTVAILEFVNQPDAKSAFKSMAYRKYHGVPLYLEWAPIKVFDTPTPAPLPKSKSAAPVDNEEEESIVPAPAKPAKNPFKPDISAAPTSKPSAPTPSTNITTTTKATTTTTPAKPIANPLKTAPAKPAPAEPESAGEPVSSLYVTNISFKTKDENLIKLFNKQPGYTNMNIPKKIDKKTKLPTMSSGNAFVTFDTPEQAASALKALQGASLDGFKLKLAFTNPKKKEGGIPATIPRPPVANKASNRDDEEKETVLPGQADDKGPTKVMIRNIPFEANESEVSALFKSVGGFKQLRMPQKMDHKHRGFGFVEFLTHNEAKKALETMANTHLYGRHLVLEFANADRNLDEIRKKTRKDYEKLARAEGKPLDWFDV